MPAERVGSNPILGQRFDRKSKFKLLVVAFFDPNGVLTIRESIAAIQRMSRYEVDVANLWPPGSDWLSLPQDLDLSGYNGIIFHPTVSYNPENVSQIDRKLSLKLEDYRGVKVLVKQDEQFRAGRLAPLVSDKLFDLIVTCLAPSEWEKVYPREVIGSCRILQALTGFVSPEMETYWREPAIGRAIDVGYRGSLQPLSFGHLGLEKREIGQRFLKFVESHHVALSCDISSRWEDRLSGQEWVNFLQNSRTTLGVESGSNLFDFDGQVEERCLQFATDNSDLDPWSPAYYEKAHKEFLHLYEGNVLYNQISPRHLEAAAAGSVQILYEGEYSNIFKPWRHYIPLRKDFSNFAEVVEAIRDDNKLRQIAHCAFEEIICNRKYRYQHFISELDDAIEAIAIEKGGIEARSPSVEMPATANDRPVIFILASHNPVMDPRIGWWAESLSRSFTVVEVGLYHSETGKKPPIFEQISSHRFRIQVGSNPNASSWMHFTDTTGRIDSNKGLSVLKNIMLIGALGERDVDARIGLFSDASTRGRFLSYVQYYLVTNATLIEVGLKLNSPSIIISCDLDTLAAGVALSESWAIPLIYDAHEFWPYAFPGFIAGESSFWETVERTLITSADLRIGVSPQLTGLMEEAYGVPFITVPNAVPKKDARQRCSSSRQKGTRETIEFLYQGIFAPTRGIDLLIKAWSRTPTKCVLVLRGPAGAYRDAMRDLAEREGVLGSRVIFSDPVEESDLIEAASRSDVGVIPYEPANINNKFCCPNKLSQYMAAGLPILANKTEFIRDTLEKSEAGICVDFAEVDALVAAIVLISDDHELRNRMSSNAHDFFQMQFNWDVVSSPAMAAVSELAAKAQAKTSKLDWSWVEAEAIQAESDTLMDEVRPLTLASLASSASELKRLKHVEGLLQDEVARLQCGISELKETVASLLQVSQDHDHLKQVHEGLIMRPSLLLRRAAKLVYNEFLRRVGYKRD